MLWMSPKVFGVSGSSTDMNLNLCYMVFDADPTTVTIRRLLHQRPKPVKLKRRRRRGGMAVKCFGIHMNM